MQPTLVKAGQPEKPLWPQIQRALSSATLFALLWWALTGGEPSSWLIGVPAVLAAGVSAVALGPVNSSRVHVTGLARFIPFFLWRSLLGSVDVAWRALHCQLPISPSLETYPLRLPAEGPARVFFANAVNLLPGTLSAELHDKSLTVHALNGGTRALDKLRELEAMVAVLFGHELAPPSLPQQVTHE
jgi:multicomponent Na+:H+ antiporter subunit E